MSQLADNGQVTSGNGAEGPKEFVRFNVGQRGEHLLLMTAFTMLCITGVPQHFYGEPWAAWIINLIGGIELTRLIHRFFASLLVIQSFYHVAYLILGVLRRTQRPYMVPRKQDFLDALNMLRYSLGVRSHPPQFDRYDYRQKFEYWGLVLGNAIMIVTGSILWFPVLATRILPGELVPAAKEMHGGEALLALLVITIWHLYSVHLSPVQFPGDVSIFTGKVSRHKMIEEHPLEYARLMGIPAMVEGARPEGARPEHEGPGAPVVPDDGGWVPTEVDH